MAEESFSAFDLANGAADKISPPPDFDGPVRNRRITDPLCFLVLLAVWGVTAWLGVWALQTGDFKEFVHPIDYKGRVCGFDKDGSGNELPSLWHPVDFLSNGICVDACPSAINLEPTNKSDLICKDDEDLLQMEGCLSGSDISSDPNVLVTCGGCMYSMGIDQKKYDCIPSNVGEVIDAVNVAAEAQGLDPLNEWSTFRLQSYMTMLTEVLMKDLDTSFYVVAGGLGGSALLGLCFLLLFLVPKCIPFTVWASAVLVPCAFGGGGTFFWFLSSTYEKDQSGVHSDLKALIMYILAITFWSISGIALISIILLRTKLNLTIALTKAGTRAIREVKRCVLLPIFQFVVYAMFLATMALLVVYFVTTADLVEKTESLFGNEVTYTTRKFPHLSHYKFWFMVFNLIWTSSFILTFGQLSLSLSFAQWYFTPEKDEGNSVSILRCTCTTLARHIGTVAYVSLALGPIAVIRSPLLLVQKCIRRSGAGNFLIDAFICSCQCCLFTLERFLKFASKNAFVQTAVFGYSFCKSSHESYYLIKRNSRNVSDAGPVGFLCTFFTRIMLVVVTCLGSYFAMERFYIEEMYSIVSVTAFIGLLSWFSVGFFMETVTMSVMTLFQCFIIDEEMLGNEGSYYAPKEIDEFLARLDESRNAELNVPKAVEESDAYTVESGIESQSASRATWWS